MRCVPSDEPVETGEALEVLRHREAQVEARGLGHDRDPCPDRRPVLGAQAGCRRPSPSPTSARSACRASAPSSSCRRRSVRGSRRPRRSRPRTRRRSKATRPPKRLVRCSTTNARARWTGRQASSPSPLRHRPVQAKRPPGQDAASASLKRHRHAEVVGHVRPAARASLTNSPAAPRSVTGGAGGARRRGSLTWFNLAIVPRSYVPCTFAHDVASERRPTWSTTKTAAQSGRSLDFRRLHAHNAQ